MLLYYITIIAQVYCLYHAYKNRSEYYWYFIIFFIPLVGCLVYLFLHVLNKKDVAHISEEITTIINPTKKIRDLEKKLNFSNTFQNKINLADAYVDIKDYENAIQYYEDALVGNFKDNPHTLNKLLFCHYQLKNYNKTIEISKKIDLEKEFKSSHFYVGLSYEALNQLDKAEDHLKKLDLRYSNYEERLELSNFLIRQDRKIEAKEIFNEIINEITSTSNKTRTQRTILSQAKNILTTLN